MSQRIKRPNRSDDGSVPTKRRKRPTTAQEEEEATTLASWKPINDLKIYNRTTTEAPAELFRKDLISAMKLPDSEPLASDEYWVIVDQWKQEWERGVQVPVNPDSLPEPSVTVTHCAPVQVKPSQEFKPPKTKYIRITKDDNFKPEEHALSSAPAQAEAACSYDLDECDEAWLKVVNNERSAAGLNPIMEDQLERVMERLELRCWDKIQAILRNEEGLGIEYDENVICDVCRSPDSEEGNEMVFCDSCNICVHQACYGITRIPEGQWLCCTCTISQRPECVLCPNKGGAMKCTRSGQKWAHVSCALWIPEVSIGCVEKMEPITKISSIPQSRWALICVLCRERVGACIQCSVKTCKTAYHVTCAFKHGLEMRAIIEDENADDGVKLRSYCEKHSKSSKKEKSICSGSEDDDCKRKKRKDMTSEEKNQARAARLQEIEAEFYKHVSIKDIAVHIDIDSDALQYIYNYWKLKRKAGHNKPLLPPKCEDIDVLSHKQEQADLEKMKMFVQLRQDLERVRNLCYMVSRREKLSRTFFKMREQTFHKQAAVLQNTGTSLSPNVVQAVIEANHGPSIYDKLYSHSEAEDNTNFDTILARIAGLKSPHSGDEKKPEINGLFKDVKNNPYKKLYFNGSSKRRSGSLYGGSSLSSASSSDERPKDNKENRLHSTSEDEKPFNKKRSHSIKNSSKLAERRKKQHSISKSKLDSSSEDDIKPPVKFDWSKSRLKQIENELGVSASDSDELMPIKSSSHYKTGISAIYSDSDSSDTSVNKSCDSQSQSQLRTKAAVKEFSKPSTSKKAVSPDGKKKETNKKESKKKNYVPSDLIVPQRQAAKKATENIKSNTGGRGNKEQPVTNVPEPENKPQIIEEKPKVKAKVGRPPKENKEEIKPKEITSKKENKKEDVFDIEKEMEKEQDILAYVPQRQAAKKAAEHIKSGLGKPGATENQTDDKNKKESPDDKAKKDSSKKEADSKKEVPVEKKKESEVVNKGKDTNPAKVCDKRKSTSNSSTSSSSSSSSDSSTSSSSESEDDQTTKQPQSESLLKTKRTGAKDWPFLDKGAKFAASSSSSDSTDSSRPSTPQPSTKLAEKKEPPRTPKQIPARSSPNKPSRKSTDQKSTPPEREESTRSRGKGRPTRGRPKSTNASDRLGNVNVRTRNISECRSVERDGTTKARKGKSDVMEDEQEETHDNKLFSSIGETDKKINEPPKLHDLEKEILERKAASNKPANKSVFDKIFEKSNNDKIYKSPTKENKPRENKSISTSPSKTNKKSPIKTKSIEDIFCNKITTVPFLEKSKSQESELEIERELHKSDCGSLSDFKLESEPAVISLSEDPEEIPVKINEAMAVPSASSPITNKDSDILADIDNILDGNFGISKDDEVMRVPLTFSIGNTTLIKEDSKEDSARETLNLVEKLRMGLSKKYDLEDSIRNDNDMISPLFDSSHKMEESKEKDSDMIHPPQINLDLHVEVTNANFAADDKTSFADYQSSTQINMQKPESDIDRTHLDSTSQEADERWVPPSDGGSYLSVKTFNDVTPYMYESQQSISQDRIQDDLKNESPNILHDRRITQTPYLDPASMDCMPSPSPYADMHPQAKWADSQIMPTRRSSSSSVASSPSNVSRHNEDEDLLKRQEMLMMNNPNVEGIPFGVLPQTMPFQPGSLDNFPQFSEASQFVSTPVSLFPPPNINTQIPFPSPGAAMFPPFGASFPTPHSVIPPLQKPMEESIHFPPTACTAAFTSSQHNMALTAAMVNLPPVPNPPKEEEKPIEPEVLQPPPSNEVPADTQNHVEPSPNPSLKSNSSAGKKSPSKPTRTSARFISQQNKSPNKSPGKSPRQEFTKSSVQTRTRDTKKVSGKAGGHRGNQSHTRGRGRRGRGRISHSHDYDYNNANTIHNKLVGTVYDLDFDDDMSNEMGDLRTMRERRKSVDVHERKNVDISRDSSESPKFTSPAHKGRFNANLSELRPPTPIEEVLKPASPDVTAEEEEPKTFVASVQPVLPGPVDMRTYNNTFETTQNLLGAFGSGTVEQPPHEELDEYFEKELHNALTKKVEEPQIPEMSNIKVSLSDSRNQLKVKIKGPISNYTATVTPIPSVSDASTTIPSNSVSNNSTINTSSGGVNLGTSTNLRRMRKKELLRQYWTQDMNMDDPTHTPGFTTPVTPSINRTIITIPKAVASMTSIPTKDDYRDYRTGTDEIFDSKMRKEKTVRPGTRELRQLDIVAEDDNSMERRRSIGSNSGLDAGSNKRRGRPPRTFPSTPKLKIKISGNSIVSGTKIDEKKDRIRPPKKRLSIALTKPSVEDLKRESMKFRKQVMADFGEEKKEKKKKDKSNKKSKKKKKQEVQIIANEGTNTPKLIIRFGKKLDVNKSNNLNVEPSEGSTETKVDADVVSNKDCERTENSNPVEQCSGENPVSTLVRTNKVTPIKLKLSRCQEGSGYVMKTPPPEETSTTHPVLPNQTTSSTTLNLPEPPPPVHTATTLPLNKDCEVR